jgi:anti-sigma regulatory factor (Ser/Thr protein kinase)
VGFFDYFGASYGKRTDEAHGSDTFIPISIRRTSEIRELASEGFSAIGDVLHREAERLATVLTRSDSGDLQDTLAYSIREILRNVVEHSEADEIVFSAQFWPTKHQVEVVVADQGIGLAKSLIENPKLDIATDEEALKQAIMPGVSSKAWRRGRRHDEWANSGYGLFMTERLCSLGGTFALISGTGILHRRAELTTIKPFRWHGTVVILQLDTSKLDSLSRRLSDFRDEGAAIERHLKNFTTGPSRASTSAKPSKWNSNDD